ELRSASCSSLALSPVLLPGTGKRATQIMARVTRQPDEHSGVDRWGAAPGRASTERRGSLSALRPTLSNGLPFSVVRSIRFARIIGGSLSFFRGNSEKRFGLSCERAPAQGGPPAGGYPAAALSCVVLAGAAVTSALTSERASSHNPSTLT